MTCPARIIPAIIPTSIEDVQAIVETYRFAPTIQIDVVDGVFAAPASWPYQPVGDISAAAVVCDYYEVQVDIMALHALETATEWVAIGATEVVVHIESIADIRTFAELRAVHNTKVWLAANDTFAVENLVPLLPYVDGIQLMGIHTIGQQGQPLSEYVVSNIQKLRAQAPEIPILIDGSVNHETIQTLATAGATDFVVGSAISGANDPRAAYQQLCALVGNKQ